MATVDFIAMGLTQKPKEFKTPGVQLADLTAACQSTTGRFWVRQDSTLLIWMRSNWQHTGQSTLLKKYHSAQSLIRKEEPMLRSMCYHQPNNHSQTYTWLPAQKPNSLIQNRGRRKLRSLPITVAGNMWKLESRKPVTLLLSLINPAQDSGRWNWSL